MADSDYHPPQYRDSYYSSRPGNFHFHPGAGFSPPFMHTANAANMSPFTGMPHGMPHGFFPGTGRTTFNNPMMLDNSIGTMNMFGAGDPVIGRLYEASLKGAELNSNARHPPPRCFPNTRKTITEKLCKWTEDDNREADLFWIYGYAGVGKTAVAQTVGEWAKENNLLGAAFFFSRARNHTDPSRLFISIAHQLASQNELYRHAITQQLCTDIGLLDKDAGTQFKKLLIEPLSQLKLDKKLLIIIDGLDECHGRDEQCAIINFVDSAANFSNSPPLPVIWMIYSRPEPQIKRTFFKAECHIKCRKEEVEVADPETKRDVKNFILAEFKKIVEKYTLVEGDGSWPAPEDVDKIVCAALGHFLYATTIIKYIGDENFADPEGQLKAVITRIEDSRATSITQNPFHYLDKLYEQIISQVPEGSLQLVLQIIAISSLYTALPVLQLANLFGLTQVRFYALFHHLYSVVEVPPPERASKDHIQVFHTSFLDFLKDPTRAGRSLLKEQDAHAVFIKACLGVLGQTKLHYAKRLSWSSKDDPPAFLLAHHILAYCAANVWTACTNLGDVEDSHRDVLDKIIDFDYGFLRSVEDKLPVSSFYEFCLWLRKQIRKHDLENIVQPVKWDTEYLQERFGECDIDSSGNDALRCLTLGKESKRITVMMSSDQLMLSRED